VPVAHINLLKGHPRETLQRMILEVSNTIADILSAPKDRLEVWVTEIDPELWGIEGRPASEVLKEKPRSSVEMPYVEMVLMEGRTPEQHHQVIKGVTDVIARQLGTQRERIRVHIANCRPDNWGIGGTPAAILRQAEIQARAKAAGEKTDG
jgi:4-oxalocrotonate tautomerase family enzyme